MYLRVKLEQYTRTINGPLGPVSRTPSYLIGQSRSVTLASGSIAGRSYHGLVGLPNSDRNIYAYTLHKKRGRMVDVVTKKGRKTITTKRWQPTTWTMTVTIIPLSLFEMLPPKSKFTQHKHHWTLETK